MIATKKRLRGNKKQPKVSRRWHKTTTNINSTATKDARWVWRGQKSCTIKHTHTEWEFCTVCVLQMCFEPLNMGPPVDGPDPAPAGSKQLTDEEFSRPKVFHKSSCYESGRSAPPTDPIQHHHTSVGGWESEFTCEGRPLSSGSFMPLILWETSGHFVHVCRDLHSSDSAPFISLPLFLALLCSALTSSISGLTLATLNLYQSSNAPLRVLLNCSWHRSAACSPGSMSKPYLLLLLAVI